MVAALAAGWIVLAQVSLPSESPREGDAQVEKPLSGAELARAYCSACHMFPEPGLLTQSDWARGALRQMALFLGAARLDLDQMPDGEILREAGIFPKAPLVSAADWESMVGFYLAEAPAQGPAPEKIQATADLFIPRPLLRSSDGPCTTLLQFDAEEGCLYVGDAQTRTLKRVNPGGAVLREWETDSGPVALNRLGRDLIVTLVGRILPSDELAGQIWALTEDRAASVKRLRRGMRRPVHTTVVDLDQDGRDDLVTCEFGNRLGQFAWHRLESDGEWKQEVLLEGPGAVRCAPWDWNGDGKIDLTLLRAQGKEGIDLFLNRGGGELQRHTIVDDPPSYGNVFLDLADFDGDARPELLVVNGDSGDYPCAGRPYHGVRIFAVTGDLKAELRFRFSLFGAYGARAADFDLDGDLDIAVISYFPDYQRAAEQSFAYLRNDGGWRFTPHIVPGLTQGRWMVMDAGDLDADGDVDLVLGSFVRGPMTVPISGDLRRRWESEKIAVIMLENQTRVRK